MKDKDRIFLYNEIAGHADNAYINILHSGVDEYLIKSVTESIDKLMEYLTKDDSYKSNEYVRVLNKLKDFLLSENSLEILKSDYELVRKMRRFFSNMRNDYKIMGRKLASFVGNGVEYYDGDIYWARQEAERVGAGLAAELGNKPLFAADEKGWILVY